MRNRYETENFFLAVALVLIVLFADPISAFLTDVILNVIDAFSSAQPIRRY